MVYNIYYFCKTGSNDVYFKGSCLMSFERIFKRCKYFQTPLSIVILATPGEFSVQSLLTKSLEHSSIHYFCFCYVKFAQFFF